MSPQDKRRVLVVNTGKQDLKLVCIRTQSFANRDHSRASVDFRVVNKKCRVFH